MGFKDLPGGQNSQNAKAKENFAQDLANLTAETGKQTGTTEK